MQEIARRTALAICALATIGSADPGVLLELDRSDFALRVVDLASGEEGPRLRVALGSPQHPTPGGDYPIDHVVRNPGWRPGPVARALGARAVAPSSDGPLGIGKIPFALGGRIALHGGAHPLLIGKPVSLGCARATDEDLLRLFDWLEQRGALRRPVPGEGGELFQSFRRPARVRVN